MCKIGPEEGNLIALEVYRRKRVIVGLDTTNEPGVMMPTFSSMS